MIFFPPFLQIQQTATRTARVSALLYSWVIQSVRSSVTPHPLNSRHNHLMDSIHNSTVSSILMERKCHHPVSPQPVSPVSTPVSCHLSHIPPLEPIPLRLQALRLFRRVAWDGHVTKRSHSLINRLKKKKKRNKINRLLLLQSLPKLRLHTLSRFDEVFLKWVYFPCFPRDEN